MDEKVTYVLEIRSPYKDIGKTISYLFTNKKPLYIAKNENDNERFIHYGHLEYLADITKIKAMPSGFVIHIDKEKVTEIIIDE